MTKATGVRRLAVGAVISGACLLGLTLPANAANPPKPPTTKPVTKPPVIRPPMVTPPAKPPVTGQAATDHAPGETALTPRTTIGPRERSPVRLSGTPSRPTGRYA